MSNPPTLYQRITHRADVLLDSLLYPFARLFSHESNGVYIPPKQPQNKLEDLRSEITKIDSRIAGLLIERFRKCKEIGEHKKENGLPLRDEQREEELTKRLSEELSKEGINPAFAKQFYRLVLAESYSIQEKNRSPK